MWSDGIINQEGRPIIDGCINPLMGYQCVHKVTGRILPQCHRYEIYGWNALMNKMDEVDDDLINDSEFLIKDYDIVPIYQTEVDEMKQGFMFIFSDDDFLDGDQRNLFI